MHVQQLLDLIYYYMCVGSYKIFVCVRVEPVRVHRVHTHVYMTYQYICMCVHIYVIDLLITSARTATGK